MRDSERRNRLTAMGQEEKKKMMMEGGMDEWMDGDGGWRMDGGWMDGSFWPLDGRLTRVLAWLGRDA